jgi:hypothetical protein
MRQATPTQRSVFNPGLTWTELPDSAREQALEVLTILALEIVAGPRLAEPTHPNASDAPSPRSPTPFLPTQESETHDPLPH